MANTTETMEGLFKRVYDDRVRYIYPNGVRLVRDIPFRGGASRPGESFNSAITLKFENGFTYAAPSAGSFDLESSAAGQTARANVDGYQIVLRSEIDYESVAKSSTAGPRAFMQATRHLVTNMANSHRKRQEVNAFYGQKSLGIVGGTPSTTTFEITAASWAPGIWAGAEGAHLQMSDGAVGGGVRNADITVKSVDFDTRVITLTAAATLPEAGDEVQWKGSFTEGDDVWNEAPGVSAIINPASGATELFGLKPDDYTLWTGNVVEGGGGLTFEDVQTMTARAAEKGGGEGSWNLYISTNAWIGLLEDQAAFRHYESKDDNGMWRTGAESLVFYTQAGPVEIKPSIFVKRSDAFLLDMACWSRVGAVDFTFGDPVEQQVFHRLEDKAGFDARSYSNQSMFSDAVGHNACMTDIV